VAWAQVLPAAPGALLGIPLGLGLYVAANAGAVVTIPPVWWLALASLGILAAVAAMASIPALIGSRVPASQVLQAENRLIPLSAPPRTPTTCGAAPSGPQGLGQPSSFQAASPVYQPSSFQAASPV
jgi:hypothetical protein